MLKRLILVLFSVGMGLGLVEIGIRISPPAEFARYRSFRYLFLPDPLIRFTLKPNIKCNIESEAGGTFQVETNSFGFRDPAYHGKDGRRNILGLGDSFLFADSNAREDGMFALLQQMLDGRSSGRWRAINAGVPGYGTNQEILYYFERGARDFDPNVVVLFFYMNDVIFTTSVDRNEWEFRRGIPVAAMIAADQFSVDTVYQEPRDDGGYKTAQFLRFLWQIYWKNSRQIKPPAKKSNVAGVEACMFHKTMFRRQKYRFTNLWAIIKHLKKQAWLNGAKLMIVYVPAAREAEDGFARQMYYDMYDCPKSDWDWTLCIREMESIAQDVGVPFVNLIPAFKDHWDKTGQSLYFKGFGHFTPEGHRLAAAAILPELEKVLNSLDSE